ncbi:hypothetical protein KDH_21840 [Dictyobacter sp. S3.2.2.5]|uniref:Uncharacterized protein n=1 Tax=Dictyobacter halimunensis TaxID=3026934 RepID=A0ABQ6FNR1_9CHLR|nr:hypothetical protein KDH_21840 [Dictyobacter sp. S3.2.2.5]
MRAKDARILLYIIFLVMKIHQPDRIYRNRAAGEQSIKTEPTLSVDALTLRLYKERRD